MYRNILTGRSLASCIYLGKIKFIVRRFLVTRSRIQPQTVVFTLFKFLNQVNPKSSYEKPETAFLTCLGRKFDDR
jgi:hypothetical protein